jgi:CO dehydrogenase/acetyl-CoA synthase delta subunit
MHEQLQPLAAALIRRCHVAWLGGDHSITLPCSASTASTWAARWR